MKTNLYVLVALLLCFNVSAKNSLSKEKVYQNMQRVANWQLTHFERQVKKGGHAADSHDYTAWTNGALYIGMLEWAKISNDEKYFEFLKNTAEKVSYSPGPELYFADDLCVSQTYLGLFQKYRDSTMIKPTLQRLDYVLANRGVGNLDFARAGNQQRWSWCDALFMAPTVYARAAKITGNQKYLNFMNEEFKVTYDTLYNHSEKLFFRDTSYKNKREQNGEMVFWGRGNGWVIGALTIIIDNLPQNHPTRSFYIQLYKEMMGRIAGLQDKNGFWHPSLLDPLSYPMPETSCTGFFTYGLAWGINRNILSVKQYKPIAVKGWNALVSSIHADGKLGWVQQIGSDPKKVNYDMTEVYGVGAFLLAGSEMYKLK